jgi:hypothetical protein
MKKNIIIVPAIIVLLLGTGIIFIMLTSKNKNTNIPPEENIPIISSAEQEKNYETDAGKIMKNYFQEKESITVADGTNEAAAVDNIKWLDLLSKTKNNLLGLRVPVKYKDLHLNLILGLSFIEQGLRGEKNKPEEGEEKISEATKTYPWLTE